MAPERLFFAPAFSHSFYFFDEGIRDETHGENKQQPGSNLLTSSILMNIVFKNNFANQGADLYSTLQSKMVLTNLTME